MNPLKWYILGGLNFFEILHFSKKFLYFSVIIVFMQLSRSLEC